MGVDAEAKSTFRAQLHRGGLGLTEMRILLERYAEHRDFAHLQKQAREENLLGKTSDRTVQALLSKFKRRFLNEDDLPNVDFVAQAMGSTMSDTAKKQIIFPYVIWSDPLLETCYREMVLPTTGESHPKLSREDVEICLDELAADHEELQQWSDQMRVRWSQAFLSFLRQFGLLTPHPDTHLKRLWLPPEPFAFFWIWFWQIEGSFWDTYRDDIWAILQLDDEAKDNMLVEGQTKGWWRYVRSADIVDFEPDYETLEGWLRDGLE